MIAVENLVKWVKSNFLPGRRFADDDDLAEHSLAWTHEKAEQISQAHGRRPVDLWAQERAAFVPLTTTAATYGLYRVATVNRESLVRIDGNQVVAFRARLQLSFKYARDEDDD